MGASDRGALPRFRLRKATGATSSEADSGRHRRNGLAASAQCNGGRPIVTTHAFVSGSHVVRDTQRLGGDPSRPRKRGSAPRGGTTDDKLQMTDWIPGKLGHTTANGSASARPTARRATNQREDKTGEPQP